MNQAPKTELAYLTAFFEGRKVVKTQFDRDALHRLVTFKNPHETYDILQKQEFAFAPTKHMVKSTNRGAEK